MNAPTNTAETPKQAARRLSESALAKGFRPTGIHEYADADGTPLFWRTRMKHPQTGEKWIRPMHQDGGQFVMGEPAFPDGKPLYRLPAIASNKGAPVFVVEGESCVEALERLGIVATTSGGADSAARADWSPLAGRAVTIWPDNDAAGQRYGSDVAERLASLGCTVRVIDVSALGLPPKGDAIDWLAANPGSTIGAVWALPVVDPSVAGDAEKQDRVALVASRRLSDLKPERVRWLWPGRIARGKVTVLAGHPGLGKSQTTASLAAIVTTGGLWPVDRTRAEAGSVVILSAEDDAVDTILPRMMAAGADTRRIQVLDASIDIDASGKRRERAFDITRDTERLAGLLDEMGDVALVVIDPVTAYLGDTDSHRNAEVRAALTPITVMAARYGVAVLAVSHLSKGGGNDPLLRVTGSLAFVAAARAAWVIAKDPGDPARRLFLPLKNNIGPDATGLAFRIESATVADGIETSHVAWDSEIVTMSAAEALAADGGQGGAGAADEAPQRAEAEDWLLDVLAVGPVAVEKLKAQARADGLAWRTVRRAQETLGVKAKRRGYGADGRWSWELPDEGGHLDPQDQRDVDTFDSREAENRYAVRVSSKASMPDKSGHLCGHLWTDATADGCAECAANSGGHLWDEGHKDVHLKDDLDTFAESESGGGFQPVEPSKVSTSFGLGQLSDGDGHLCDSQGAPASGEGGAGVPRLRLVVSRSVASGFECGPVGGFVAKDSPPPSRPYTAAEYAKAAGSDWNLTL